jgi:hypothetical protein
MLESQMVDLSKVPFDLTLKISSKRSCLIGFISSFTFSHLATKLMSSLRLEASSSTALLFSDCAATVNFDSSMYIIIIINI